VTGPKKPTGPGGRPVLGLPRKPQGGPAAPGGKGAGKPPAPPGKAPAKPQKPPLTKPAPGQQCRLCGQFFRGKGPPQTPSPPRPPEAFMAVSFMVMRANGQRPRVRHATLAEAQEEARRIAQASPGADVWILECRTVETRTTATPAQTGGSVPEQG
jgi:hypothetical protein